MNRRSFLQALATGVSALVLDPERALWVPGAKKIFLPPLIVKPVQKQFVQSFQVRVDSMSTLSGWDWAASRPYINFGRTILWVSDVGMIERPAAAIEVTHFESPNGYREYIQPLGHDNIASIKLSEFCDVADLPLGKTDFQLHFPQAACTLTGEVVGWSVDFSSDDNRRL